MCYAATKQPSTYFITRPLAVGTEKFADKPMTSRKTWAWLTQSLKALGMYICQSVYSTKRGTIIQKRDNLQATHKEIGEAAMCNEGSARYYNDMHSPTRHREQQPGQLNFAR